MSALGSLYELVSAMRKDFKPFTLGKPEITLCLVSIPCSFNNAGDVTRFMMCLHADEEVLHFNSMLTFDVSPITNQMAERAVYLSQRRAVDACSLTSLTLEEIDREENTMLVYIHAGVYFPNNSTPEARASQQTLLESTTRVYFNNLALSFNTLLEELSDQLSLVRSGKSQHVN